MGSGWETVLQHLWQCCFSRIVGNYVLQICEEAEQQVLRQAAAVK